MREPNREWHRLSPGNARMLLRALVNTVRLASGPAEAAHVLRAFLKALRWRLVGSGRQRDELLCLQGVIHVFGLGTGELLTPHEVYWEHSYDRLPDFVPQAGWIVFDVGANAGVYAVQQARRGADVYAFEPNPDCYRRLRKSVHANRLENQVTTINCALGAMFGSADLLIPEGLTLMGSLQPQWTPRAGENRLEVVVETVDRVVRTLGISRIDLLKVDVEGLELDVLQGARESFSLVDRLVLEYHSLDLGRRVVRLLIAQGFEIVLDERRYRGDENMYKGAGRGLLFAKRQGGSVSGQTDAITALA